MESAAESRNIHVFTHVLFMQYMTPPLENLWFWGQNFRQNGGFHAKNVILHFVINAFAQSIFLLQPLYRCIFTTAVFHRPIHVQPLIRSSCRGLTFLDPGRAYKSGHPGEEGSPYDGPYRGGEGGRGKGCKKLRGAFFRLRVYKSATMINSYISVHKRSFLDILPNFNLIWTLQCIYVGPLFPRI